MFTLYWTKFMYQLPSIRFTVSISTNSCTKVTGWAENKKWTLPSIPTHQFPLTQSLHATVLSLPGLDYTSKRKIGKMHHIFYRWITLSEAFITAICLFLLLFTQFPSPPLNFISFTLLPIINPLQISQCRHNGRRKMLLSGKRIKILNPLK